VIFFQPLFSTTIITSTTACNASGAALAVMAPYNTSRHRSGRKHEVMEVGPRGVRNSGINSVVSDWVQ
jgi:hypothetical protein